MGTNQHIVAHRLIVRENGRYLRPRLVIARLQCAFAYVEGDEDAGRRHVGYIIRQLDAMARKGFADIGSEYLQRLKKAQSESIYVYFGDNPGSELNCLHTALIPNEPLYFDYASATHENAARPLLMRCAEVLGYEPVEVPVEPSPAAPAQQGSVSPGIVLSERSIQMA